MTPKLRAFLCGTYHLRGRQHVDSFPICVCMYVCMHVCAYVCARAHCTHVCSPESALVEVRGQYQLSSPRILHLMLVKDSLSLNLGLIISVRLSAGEGPGSACLCPASMGDIHTTVPTFYMDAAI